MQAVFRTRAFGSHHRVDVLVKGRIGSDTLHTAGEPQGGQLEESHGRTVVYSKVNSRSEMCFHGTSKQYTHGLLYLSGLSVDVGHQNCVAVPTWRRQSCSLNITQYTPHTRVFYVT